VHVGLHNTTLVVGGILSTLQSSLQERKRVDDRVWRAARREAIERRRGEMMWCVCVCVCSAAWWGEGRTLTSLYSARDMSPLASLRASVRSISSGTGCGGGPGSTERSKHDGFVWVPLSSWSWPPRRRHGEGDVCVPERARPLVLYGIVVVVVVCNDNRAFVAGVARGGMYRSVAAMTTTHVDAQSCAAQRDGDGCSVCHGVCVVPLPQQVFEREAWYPTKKHSLDHQTHLSSDRTIILIISQKMSEECIK
jgi:hypothetical protein